MKRLFVFLLLASLVIALGISSHLSATSRGIMITTGQGKSVYLYKNYHALVVGVSNYERWPKLPNAVNDDKEVAAKLKELGFTVKLVTDPTARPDSCGRRKGLRRFFLTLRQRATCRV